MSISTNYLAILVHYVTDQGMFVGLHNFRMIVSFPRTKKPTFSKFTKPGIDSLSQNVHNMPAFVVNAQMELRVNVVRQQQGMAFLVR